MTFRPIQNDDDINTNIDNIETKLDTINASIEDLDEVASGSADSGNPVKVGGVYNATPPTLPDGARGDLQVDSSGATIVNPKALNKTDDTITAFPKGCNMSVISNTTAVTIGAGAASDTKLRAIRILAALTGTCAITGFADSDGTAQTITIPAASVGDFDFRGAKNSAGALTVTCSNASDDNLVCVFWETNTDPE